MTGPRPPIADALAGIRRKSAAEALAELRAGPDFSDVSGGASNQRPAELPIGEVEAIRERARDQANIGTAEELIQGATANFGDELGLVNRERNEQARADSPVAAIMGNITGTILNPLSRLGVPSKAANLLARIGQGAAGGAAIGGLASAGNAEGSLADRLPEAEQGAAAGAVVGGAIPAAGAGINAIRQAPGAVKGMAGNAVLRLLGVPPGARQAASILRKLAAEGGEAAGTAAKAAEEIPFQPEPPLGRPSSPDAVAAVRDYQAGKISGEDLRTALDIAGGRTPSPPRFNPPDAPPATELPGVVPRETVPLTAIPAKAPGRLHPIKAVAVRDNETGIVHVGKAGEMHPDINERIASTDDWTEGFVDQNGRFLTRREAADLVRPANPEYAKYHDMGQYTGEEFVSDPLPVREAPVQVPLGKARSVPAGEYQRAAPATRMDSHLEDSPGRLARRIESDPAAMDANLELLRLLGQNEPNPRMVEEIARLMAARSVKP